MEVDTNELLHRIGAVLRAISNKMDQLIEIVERAGGEVWFPSEEESKKFADVLMNDACIPSDAVADEPPKKWRILEPGEVVQEGDLMNSKLNPPSDPPNGGWLAATSFCFGKEASFYSHVYFARAVADEPAKEAEPAWEPKVGDWVLVTMPEDWKLLKDPAWVASMHKYDGKVMQVVRYEQRYGAWVANFCGIDWFFNRDWLSPAEPPEPLKPPKPEYREPVLPGDFDRPCDFSSNGIQWRNGCLRGYVPSGWRDTNGVCWPCCRIKKDA
jgi:hypothetical protein